MASPWWDEGPVLWGVFREAPDSQMSHVAQCGRFKFSQPRGALWQSHTPCSQVSWVFLPSVPPGSSGFLGSSEPLFLPGSHAWLLWFTPSFWWSTSFNNFLTTCKSGTVCLLLLLVIGILAQSADCSVCCLLPVAAAEIQCLSNSQTFGLACLCLFVSPQTSWFFWLWCLKLWGRGYIPELALPAGSATLHSPVIPFSGHPFPIVWMNSSAPSPGRRPFLS